MYDDDIDDRDDIEDIPGRNRISEKKCRNCGRVGCEGGPSCELEAERQNGI